MGTIYFPRGGGGSGSSFTIDDNHFFDDNAARDSYFTTNPGEKTTGTLISVGAGYQQWDGSSWVSKTSVVTGPQGDTGDTGEGVPAAGTAGQVLEKVDGTDYNTQWATPDSVTFETLDAAGDVGTGAAQVAAGDHDHSGTYEPADATILKEADVDDTPVDAADAAPISSNWAYDHANNASAHHAHSNKTTLDAVPDHSGQTENHVMAIQADGSIAWEAQAGAGGGEATTFEVLDANGDVGTGADQVAQGDHTHSYLADVVDDSTPQLGGDLDYNSNSIVDANGNEVLGFANAASAVNYLQAKNAATGNQVELSAQGDDTNIDILLKPKGTGVVSLDDAPMHRVELYDYSESVNSQSNQTGTVDLDCEDGNIHSVSVGNGAVTFTFSNPPSSSNAGSITLILTQYSTAQTINWPASVDWPGGSAPDVSTNSAVYLLTFFTVDGGTTWYGALVGNDALS